MYWNRSNRDTRIRIRFGLGSIRDQFRINSGSIRGQDQGRDKGVIGSESSSRLVWDQFGFGLGLVQVWFEIGSRLFWDQFRIDLGSGS